MAGIMHKIEETLHMGGGNKEEHKGESQAHAYNKPDQAEHKEGLVDKVKDKIHGGTDHEYGGHAQIHGGTGQEYGGHAQIHGGTGHEYGGHGQIHGDDHEHGQAEIGAKKKKEKKEKKKNEHGHEDGHSSSSSDSD